MNRERAKKMNNSDLVLMIEAGLRKYLRDFHIIGSKESPPAQTFDLAFDLVLPDKTSHSVAAIVKQNLRPSVLPLVEARFGAADTVQKMIISDYITPPLADKLREKKIWYLDEAGNIYVDVPGKTFIYDAGHKRKPAEKQSPLISSSNAKLFFFLLRSGPKFEATYRQIEAQTGVSLGKISQSISDLKQRELIHAHKNGILLRQPVKLLELWVQAYLEKLKPQSYIGTYTSPYESDFLHIANYDNQLEGEVGIGGEGGAERLTGYLAPATLDLWVEKDYFSKVRKKLKLMDSGNGNIRVYSSGLGNMLFDEFSDSGGNVKVVHPLIIYADLLGINDSRCRETAEMVKEKYLERIK